jgi:AraC-like DNA-binding protein
VGRASEQINRRLLRARDAMDRSYPEALDVAGLAAIALMSEAHFIRSFRIAFGESPHRYLQRRRIERAMYLLRRTERPVTEIALDVGFSSLGTFCRTFRAVVGESPSGHRGRGGAASSANGPEGVPTCFAMAWGRPSSFGEARPLRSG